MFNKFLYLTGAVLCFLGMGSNCSGGASAVVCSTIATVDACNSQTPGNGSDYASACVWLASGACADANYENTCGSYILSEDCSGACAWADGKCSGAENTPGDTGVSCGFFKTQKSCLSTCAWSTTSDPAQCVIGTPAQ